MITLWADFNKCVIYVVYKLRSFSIIMQVLSAIFLIYADLKGGQFLFELLPTVHAGIKAVLL